MKLIVDLSSILGAYLHTHDEEFGLDIVYKGKEFHIPDVQTCIERFQYTVSNLDVPPKDFIVVKDPEGLPRCRTKIFKDYKKKERVAPPEFFESRKALIEEGTVWLKSQGAIVATPKNSTEADDLINEIAKRFPETVIWTRDKDLLACPTDVLYQDKDGIHFYQHDFKVLCYF